MMRLSKIFCSVSCCNVVYKLISKVIAIRLRPLLVEVVGEEQFGFLPNRQIHDAVAMAQEVLHSIKQKNLKFVMFKLDLSKAFDIVNVMFLCLALLQIGLSVGVTNWVMGCVHSVFLFLLMVLLHDFSKPLGGYDKDALFLHFCFF
jgi:hypothetical protein